MTPSECVGRLRAAVGVAEVVKIRRVIRGADRLSGFVVGVGKRWVLLNLVDVGKMDGYAAVRIKDVRRVRTYAGEGSFTLRALAHYGEGPRALPDVDLSDVAAVLVGLQAHFPTVSVYTENDHADECYIGRVARTTKTSLDLLELRAVAEIDTGKTDW